MTWGTKTRDTLAELFANGFRGSCSEIAFKTGLNKNTIYARMIVLQDEGIVQVVESIRTKNGFLHIWAGVQRSEKTGEPIPRGIVARALANRHPLQLWAAGSQQ